MPPLPNPPSPVIKLTCNWVVDGDALANTIHYVGFTGTADAADLTDYASSVCNNANAAFASICSNYVGMSGVTARDITTEMGAEVTAGTAWVGTAGTALNAPGTAMVISHQIARHYRGGKPRTYLPVGIPSDIAVTGFWTDAFVTSAGTLWGDWIGVITNVTHGSIIVGKLLNVSYYKGYTNFTEPSGRVRARPTPRPTPVLDVVTGHVARKVIGSQRRRNRDA